MGYSEWQLRIVKMSRDIVIAKMDIERNNRDLHSPRLISCKSHNLHTAIVLMAVWICPKERLHTCNLKGSNWLLELSGLIFLLLIQNTNRKDKNSIIDAVHCLKYGIIFHPRTNEHSYKCAFCSPSGCGGTDWKLLDTAKEINIDEKTNDHQLCRASHHKCNTQNPEENNQK